MFNPEMLTLARERAEMTQTALANQVGSTQGTISKIENGLREPGQDMLERFAAELRRPADFFNQQEPVYGLPPTFHRRLQSVSQKKLTAVHARINEYRLHLLRLLKAVDLDVTFEVPQLDLEEYGTPEAVARAVRGAWSVKPGPINNLMAVVERAGIIVVPMNFHVKEVDAIGWKVPPLPPLIFSESSAPPDRVRFSVAHELGHLVMHNVPTPTMEDEANRFAAEFLMPARDIDSQFDRVDLTRLAVLKEVWRVSMQALLMRAKSLNKVTDRQYRYLWRQMGARGYRRQEPVVLPPEAPRLLSRIIDTHLDDLGYSVGELSRALKLLPEEFHTYYPRNTGGLRLVS